MLSTEGPQGTVV